MENDECFRKAAKGDAHEVGIADVKVSAGSREEGREDMMAANNPKKVMESARKSSILIFGTEHFLDEYTKRRIAIGEFGSAFCGLAAIFAIIVDTATKDVPAEIVLVAFILAMFFLSMVCYKNVSFVILKRLFLEPNIILMLLLALGNVAVDVARPSSPFSWAYGVLYLFTIVPFILVDAIQVKRRSFAIFLGFLFLFLNSRNFWENTLGDASYGIAPFKYTINDKEYTVDKRSVKRSIYAQVLMFSVQGLYVMLTDKAMEKMFFGTGAIYRSTGTTSKEILELRHSIKYHVERALKRERRSKKQVNTI